MSTCLRFIDNFIEKKSIAVASTESELLLTAIAKLVVTFVFCCCLTL